MTKQNIFFTSRDIYIKTPQHHNNDKYKTPIDPITYVTYKYKFKWLQITNTNKPFTFKTNHIYKSKHTSKMHMQNETKILSRISK